MSQVFNLSSLDQAKENIFSIQSEQDGLFFGLDFLKEFYKDEDAFDIQSYLKDGDCVLKGQTCLSLVLKDKNLNTEEIILSVSYLSGAYTLTSCYVEKFNFSIIASSSENSPFPEWEEKAILKAGALIEPKIPQSICFTEEDIKTALENKSELIVVGDLKLSKKELKTLLKQIPSYIKKGLQTSCFPSDLQELEDLDFVWPTYLQGGFPLLKMKGLSNLSR